jgi:membrane protein EpsK
MNIANFLIRLIVGLWLIPYLITHIGKAAYGLVPLAMIFTEYIHIITGSINSSITRFLAIDIQKNDFENANRTFNTAFFAILGLVLIKIPILSYIVFDLGSLINVPIELITDAYYLFALTFLGYLISLFSSIFSTSLYANNRLDLIRFIEITRLLVRAAAIVGLFILVTPSLKFVGYANLISAFVGIGITLIYWSKYTSFFRIKISYFDKQIFKKITKMGSWMIVDQIGFLLVLKVDLFVVNRFIGPEAGGEYAAVQQWTKLLRSVAAVLSGVTGPMILISFAKSKIKDIIRFSKLGVKYMAIGIGIITGIISGFASQLLDIWLGNDFKDFSNLLIVMVCTLVINLGVVPLFKINQALNKVKIPGIVMIFTGLINVFMAILFVKAFDLGMMGVALAGAIVLTLKNGIYTPWYAARILNINIFTFYRPLIGGIILYFISYFICFGFEAFIVIDTWFKLIGLSGISFLISILIAWFLIISPDEKTIFIEMLPRPIRNNLF